MHRKFVHLAYRALTRFLILDVARLLVLRHSEVTAPTLPEPYTIKSLTPDEVRRFAVETDIGLESDMAGRIMTKQDLCVAVMSGERPVSYSWYALGGVEAKHNRGRHPNSGPPITLPPNMAFQYTGMTDAEHRGKGLHRCIPNYALTLLAKHNVTRIITTTDWTNVGAFRCFRKAGFRDIGLISRIGWWKWSFAFFPKTAKAEGIRLGTYEPDSNMIRSGVPSLANC